MLSIKRIYGAPTKKDGYRVLVDRLWPRGVSKEQAKLDSWLKEIAPSPDLRRWFDHQPERFAEFSEKYTDELSINPAATTLSELVKANKVVTLLYSAKDPKCNHALVLKNYLTRLD